jgi:hypothetical protein
MAPRMLRPLSEYPTPRELWLQCASMDASLDTFEGPESERLILERALLAMADKARALFVLRRAA